MSEYISRKGGKGKPLSNFIVHSPHGAINLVMLSHKYALNLFITQTNALKT